MPKFDPNSNKLNWFLDFIVLNICSGWILICFLLALLSIYNPRECMFLGVLIPDNIYSYFPWGIVVSLFHSYLLIGICLNMAITSSLNIINLFYITLLTTQELCLGRSEYRTEDILRRPNDLMRVYRALQILHGSFIVVLGPFVAFFHLKSTVFPIYVFYVLSCYGGQMDLVTNSAILTSAVSIINFWMVILQLGKYICVKGNESLWSWKEFSLGPSKDARIMSKFRRSCTPMLICYGKTFKIQRITQFMYVKGIIRGTFRSLLTLHKT